LISLTFVNVFGAIFLGANFTVIFVNVEGFESKFDSLNFLKFECF